jgi:hypothetical protein
MIIKVCYKDHYTWSTGSYNSSKLTHYEIWETNFEKCKNDPAQAKHRDIFFLTAQNLAKICQHQIYWC